jgi:hypothetical protein
VCRTHCDTMIIRWGKAPPFIGWRANTGLKASYRSAPMADMSPTGAHGSRSSVSAGKNLSSSDGVILRAADIESDHCCSATTHRTESSFMRGASAQGCRSPSWTVCGGDFSPWWSTRCRSQYRRHLEPAALEQFAFEGREEALAHGVVIGIADRTRTPTVGSPTSWHGGPGCRSPSGPALCAITSGSRTRSSGPIGPKTWRNTCPGWRICPRASSGRGRSASPSFRRRCLTTQAAMPHAEADRLCKCSL